jgi:SNF2 family DNA or RNA helicase
MEYHRVIIDEAHGLRNKATRLSRAVTQLKANYRMCLTGTLIVNKLDGAQVSYALHIVGLTWHRRRLPHLPLSPHVRFSIALMHSADEGFSRPFADWTSFRNEIAQPSKRYPDRAAKKLLGALSPVMIRRRLDTQMDGRPLVELPEKHIETVYLDLSTEERKIYEAMQANAQVEMSKYIRAGTVMKSYHCVLLLLLRLRQVCSHPALATEDPRAFAHLPSIYAKALCAVEAALDEPIEIKRAKEIDRLTSLLGQSACDKIRKALLTRALASATLSFG